MQQMNTPQNASGARACRRDFQTSSAPGFPPSLIAAHEKADPLIEVNDNLSDLVCVLRTVAIALAHPRLNEIYGLDDCTRALEFATSRIDDVRECADRRAKVFLGLISDD